MDNRQNGAVVFTAPPEFQLLKEYKQEIRKLKQEIEQLKQRLAEVESQTSSNKISIGNIVTYLSALYSDFQN